MRSKNNSTIFLLLFFFYFFNCGKSAETDETPPSIYEFIEQNAHICTSIPKNNENLVNFLTPDEGAKCSLCPDTPSHRLPTSACAVELSPNEIDVDIGCHPIPELCLLEFRTQYEDFFRDGQAKPTFPNGEEDIFMVRGNPFDGNVVASLGRSSGNRATSLLESTTTSSTTISTTVQPTTTTTVMETSTTLPFEFTTTRVQVDQQTMSHTTARSVFRFPSTTTSLQTTTITEVDGESGIRTVDSDTSTIRANVFSSPHIDGMPFPFGTTGIGRRMRVSVPFNWTTSSIPFTQSTTMIPSSNREFMPDQMPSFHHRVSEKRAELTERLITQPSTTTTNIRDHSWTLQRIAANHPANSTIIHHRLTTTVPTVRSFSRNNEFIRKETRECADSHVHCCYWALAGECDINLYWMRINCAKTCGTCNCSLREAEHCVSTGIHCTIPTTSTTTTTTTTTTQAPTTTTLLTTTTSSPPSTTLPSGRFTSRPRNLPRWKTHPLPAAPPAFNPQDNSKEVIKTRPTNGYESVVDNTKGPKFVHRPGIEEPYTTVESTVATTLSTSTLMTSTVPTSTPSSCYNYHRLCQFWADLSECTKNPFWMRPHCQRACNSCGETLQDVYAPKARPNCSNQNNLCPFWAYIGECARNPRWMLSSCAASCQIC